MELILWRHADAEDGAPDLARKLTAKGRKDAERVAKWLLKHLPDDFDVVASPAVRAQETAGYLERKIHTERNLAPGAAVSDIVSAAERGKAVVIVGHQPDLGQAAAQLVSGTRGEWSIRKGALWWLERRVREGEAQVVVRAVIGPDFL